MTIKSNSKLRVGKISYINAIPFYHKLDLGQEFDTEFYENYPAKLNEAMSQGALDVAPISSLEYLNHQEDYLLLPGIGVGARNISSSVLLMSKVEMKRLNFKKIALSRESLSSSTLLKILLRYRFRYENEFVTASGKAEESLKDHDAALVIGDSALLYESHEFIYKYDLSELWWNWLQKPFCFALWAARKDYALENPDILRQFSLMLKQNLLRNLSDLETLIKDAKGIEFTDEKFAKIYSYLFNLQYRFDEEMQEGLEEYFGYAHELGVSPESKPLEFFDVKTDSALLGA